jgi:hypothetical protein
LSASSKLGIGLVFAGEYRAGSAWISTYSLSSPSRHTAVGAGGLMASNYLEEQMPVQNDARRAKDPQHKPRLFGITVIDKQA